jgi:hypothetical protein
MSNKKPTAIEIADALWNGKTTSANVVASVNELRRLHALNAQMLAALKDAADQMVVTQQTARIRTIGPALQNVIAAIAAADEAQQ